VLFLDFWAAISKIAQLQTEIRMSMWRWGDGGNLRPANKLWGNANGILPGPKPKCKCGAHKILMKHV